MKTSPFKIRGGVTPLKQDIPVDPSSGEGFNDPMVGNKKQSEIDYSNTGGEDFENIAQFAPLTGELIDAKNSIKDFINEDYGGAALNMAGFFLPFIPGGVIKSGGKYIMDYLKKMPGVDAFLKSGKKMTKQQQVDFKKGFAESNGNPIVGGVGGNLEDTQKIIPMSKAEVDKKILNYAKSQGYKSVKAMKAAEKAKAIKKHNILVSDFDNYRKGGKLPQSQRQNMMDMVPDLEGRLKYISDNNIVDDWLFGGGVTFKNGKYFDSLGVEIPLDPKVPYMPPFIKEKVKEFDIS